MTKDALIVIAQTPQQYALANAVNSATLNANYSIPNLLSTLQNEWDAVMLETFELRSQLDMCKKELSSALYKCDAAIRVAARAKQESDELRHTLTELTEAVGGQAADAPPLPAELITAMAEDAQEYVQQTKERRKMKSQVVTAFALEQPVETACEVDRVFVNRLLDPEDRVTCILARGKARLLNREGVLLLDDLPAELKIVFPVDRSGVVFSTDSQMGIYETSTKEFKIFGSPTSSRIVDIQYSPFVAAEFLVTLNENHEIHYRNRDGSQIYRFVNGKVHFPDAGEPAQLQLHKDGLLIAYQPTFSTIAIFSVTAPKDPPIVIMPSSSTEESTGELVTFRFSPNGYWLYVLTELAFLVYDLRKQPGTLAMNPLMLNSPAVAFDTDQTGKTLFLLSADGSLESYSYVKSQNGWSRGICHSSDRLAPLDLVYLADKAGVFLQGFHALTDDQTDRYIPAWLRIE